MPTVVIDRGVVFDRDALMTAFKSEQIDSRVFFWPLAMLSLFEGARELPVSHSRYSRAINLPTYHDLTPSEMDRVIALIRSIVGTSDRA